MKRVVLLLAVALFGASCAGSTGVQVDDVWARTSAGMQNAGAVYMVITGGDVDDALISVEVGSDIAARAEVHETTMDGGMMSMQEVNEIPIDANGEVKLEPGGYHVMLMQLAEPLVDGSEFDLTLVFEKAGDVSVTADVRDS